MIIDCHCHLFSKTDLTQGYHTTSRLIRRIHDINLPGKGGSERVVRFVDHLLNYEAEMLFLKMRETYGEDYAAVPLMMDGTYVTHPPGEDFEKSSALNRLTEQIVSPISHSLRRPVEPNPNHGKKNLFAKNFTTQIIELKRLKELYPQNIYPFLGIDPRRNDYDLKDTLMDLVKDLVGPGKTFTGIKLYASLGYSPTHPFLYNSDRKVPTLYRWCQKKGIPLTVHFSPTGFAHINDAIPIRGDVYYADAGQIVPGEELYPKGIMTFKHRFLRSNFNDLVEERQQKLNHPLLWRKVLETYPRLKINFAHMGGYSQAPLYMDKNPEGFWTEAALSFLNDYSRTRVDLSNFSCHGEKFLLQRVKSEIYDYLSKSAKKRVLYGSDFYMLYLMEQELSVYYNSFCHYFGSEMDRIARDNPASFIL